MRKKFSRLANRVRKDMDPDDLHDLRVLTRRIRAVIWLSRHSRRGPGLKILRKTLRDLGHALGERRALDVIAKDASRYGLKHRALNSASDKARVCIERLLSTKRQREIDRMLSDAEIALKKLKANDLLSAVSELIVRLEELQRFRPRKAGEWHFLRIEVKKVRYASELLGLKISELKKIQDLLGRGHDLEVLMERLGRKSKIDSDMRAFWARTKRVAPAALKRAEDRLLDWRSEQC